MPVEYRIALVKVQWKAFTFNNAPYKYKWDKQLNSFQNKDSVSSRNSNSLCKNVIRIQHLIFTFTDISTDFNL